MTVSREMDNRIRANAKKLVQMVHAMKLQDRVKCRRQLTLDLEG
jgi:hypothetical protein